MKNTIAPDELSRIRSVRFDSVRILLADDSNDNQRLFERILTAAGARVSLASNGLEALQKHKQELFDLVILDVCMPLMDGHQAARALRTSGFDGPIMALTATEGLEVEARSYASGCTSFHRKPIDRVSFLNAVKDALWSRGEASRQAQC